MTKYEIELTRLVMLGEDFIPPPPIMGDFVTTNRKQDIQIILKKLHSYQRITGREIPTRILLYQSELDLIESGLLSSS